MADASDPALRAGLRGARAGGVRCLKAVVAESAPAADGGRVLTLAESVKEEAGAPLEQEFARCTDALLKDTVPCLLAFRADCDENLADSRWLAVVWLPAGAGPLQNAAVTRSRGDLARLVPNPVFLCEFFASRREELTWAMARKELFAAPVGAPPGAGAADTTGVRTQAQAAAVGSRVGPVVRSPGLDGLLQRLAKREEGCTCLKLTLGPAKPPAVATLDARPVECRTAKELARQPDLTRPGAVPCYLALMQSSNELLFVHWAAEGNPKGQDDSRQAHAVLEVVAGHCTVRDVAPPQLKDGARCAALEAEVLGIVLEAFVPPAPRALRVEAREPQDIIDGVARGGEDVCRAPKLARGVTRALSRAEVEVREFPQPGAPADFPLDWPSEKLAPGAQPASLQLPERPVPPWRGGSKAHTLGHGGASGDSMGARRTRHSTHHKVSGHSWA